MGLLVVQALAVHRDTTVAVEFFSLGWGRLVHWPAVGSLFVLFTAVPPGTQGQARSPGEGLCQPVQPTQPCRWSRPGPRQVPSKVSKELAFFTSVVLDLPKVATL